MLRVIPCGIIVLAGRPRLSDARNVLSQRGCAVTRSCCSSAPPGDSDALEELEACGTMNMLYNLGFSPLHCYARAGRAAVVRLLLRSGAAPNALDLYPPPKGQRPQPNDTYFGERAPAHFPFRASSLTPP